jgi:hypothetical protein
MNNAKCTVDSLIYSAHQFSHLPPSELEIKRRFLVCPACGGPAFFRHASQIGRAACFGARPHAQSCELAAQECDDDNHEARLISGTNKIIVDFKYGSPDQPERFYGFGHEHMQERVIQNHEQPHSHIYHRRLGSLLRTLIEFPTFRYSDQIVEVEGHGNMAARDLFVALQCATYQYSGIYRGYFGVISDAKLALDNSLWLNSGGNDNISFCIDSKCVDAILQRYGIKDLEAIAGAYILVLGTPRVSQNGKLFCVIEDINLMTLRLT